MTEKRKPHLYDFFRVHLVYDSFTDLWWVHLYEVSQNAPPVPRGLRLVPLSLAG